MPFFLNVYLPYQCDNNYDDYMQYMGKIASIINESTSCLAHVAVVGDSNAKRGSPFEKN